MLDWPKVSALPWRARRAAVEAAAREHLSGIAGIFTTRQIAFALLPSGAQKEENAIASELSKIAPRIGAAFATHDGEEFRAYGRTNRRWRWHGQKTEE